MVKSMTGYGRAEDVIDGMQIAVEMKSVNHRYLEFSAKVPRSYGFLEDRRYRAGQPFPCRWICCRAARADGAVWAAG